MNGLFGGFLLLAIAVALGFTLAGDASVSNNVSRAMFDSADLAVQVSLGLVGVLTLWSGFFRLAERSALTDRVARKLAPLLTRLMPELVRTPSAIAPVTMNLSANVLGLDNAATPLGLKAMEAMQAGNSATPDRATDAQIMFLVMNTSSVTLLPVTVFMYRAQQGAANPADIYAPMLIATTVSTFFGIWLTAKVQGISLRNPLILGVAGIWLTLLTALVVAVTMMSASNAAAFSSALGSGVLLAAVATFVIAGWRAGLDVYQTFIEGAQEGFNTAIRLIPYLVAMLVAIGMLRAAGVLDLLLDGVRVAVAYTGLDSRFVDALPVALMKPLSGSGARAMMLEVMNTHGVDSLAGRMAAVMQGSTETTLYVLAVYFGSAGITHIRHALWCGLAADVAGLITAILATYLFFG
ncbi:MAG: spore maturation protein [Gammaproteobacteria bacterium]|nr:spore maturation protein [Gammaproteobacteria bacterium]MBQ0775747.1 spore maturation protein [Gammaproteobacteria bacterium]